MLIVIHFCLGELNLIMKDVDYKCCGQISCTWQVALQNALVSHTEGLLKKAISSLQEIQSKDGK
jgi:hypothetical protein